MARDPESDPWIPHLPCGCGVLIMSSGMRPAPRNNTAIGKTRFSKRRAPAWHSLNK